MTHLAVNAWDIFIEDLMETKKRVKEAAANICQAAANKIERNLVLVRCGTCKFELWIKKKNISNTVLTFGGVYVDSMLADWRAY